MPLLAIDCATDACSAALWIRGGPGPGRFEPMKRGHGEALMPMVQSVMTEAGLSFADLDSVAVTVGPGAFTGLRIGMSAARGIALAAGKPLIGVTTLEAVAGAQDPWDGLLLVVLGSKRADVYAQIFEPDGAAACDPCAVPPEEVSSMLPAAAGIAVAGDAAAAVMAALAGRRPKPVRLPGPGLPDAAVVARIAAGREAGAGDPPGPPAPLYLRPPDAITAADRKSDGGR